MAATERLSLYVTPGERAALKEAARRLGASENYVTRLAIRHLTGLHLSELNHAEISRAKHTQLHTSTS